MFTPKSILGVRPVKKSINFANGQPTKKECRLMKVKGIIFEDTVNYKKISMTIIMPYCDFKCDKECDNQVCQNSQLANTKSIDVDIRSLIDRYIDNPITEAIVFQGLEPFDSWEDLYAFIHDFVLLSDDDIVIYTGYKELEISDKVEILRDIVGNKNTLIVKYGRFIPNRESKYDEFLGVTLASDNQYSIMENRLRTMN